ncbi:MAG: thioesterase family protein [Nitrososphaerota archaeon]
MKSLEPGLKLERKIKTKSEHSAKHLGSGDVEVLSTPSMILFMEETCRILASNYLEEGKTTVGTHVDIYHVKAAPIGIEIEIKSILLSIEGKKLIFWVEALWENNKIGYGIHERYIVDKDRFISELKK